MEMQRVAELGRLTRRRRAGVTPAMSERAPDLVDVTSDAGPGASYERVAPAGVGPAFEVAPPRAGDSPLVYASPHSGRRQPADLIAAARISANALKRIEDAYVEELFAAAPDHGAPLIHALVSRAYLDLNREPYELDPAMFRDRLPDHANIRSPRVAAGLGAIARVVGDGEEIYARKLTLAEAEKRIAEVYRPYHAALATLLDQARARFGVGVLIDCHSMPSSGPGGAQPGADVVLGDRFGASCHPGLTTEVERILRQMGYRVARNAPYAGGHITQTYGRPHHGLHALQIEINRGLYMDERTLERRPAFAALRADMARLIQALAAVVPCLLRR